MLKLLYIACNSRGTHYHKLSRNALPPLELSEPDFNRNGLAIPPPTSWAVSTTCTSWVGDLLCQVSESQETAKRLRSIRGAKLEIDVSFQKHVPVTDITENEAPWTLGTHKSRTPPQSLPSSMTTKNRQEALTAADTHEQDP